MQKYQKRGDLLDKATKVARIASEASLSMVKAQNSFSSLPVIFLGRVLRAFVVRKRRQSSFIFLQSRLDGK